MECMAKKRTVRQSKKLLKKRITIFCIVCLLLLAFGAWWWLHRGIVIAIDPGHGGGDIGAIGIVREVTINETTARYLQELLRDDPQYYPALCRSYGQGATLEQRGRRAERAGASLLISIHANASLSGSSGGFECYPAPPGRANHADSLAFAYDIVEEIAATGMTMRGENGVRYLYYENGEKVFRESSDTSIYDLHSLAMVENKDYPAVLVEQCFIDYQRDVDLLGTDEGCRLAAACYYRAICRYFGTEPII